MSDLDRFANGITARRRPAVYCQDNETLRPDYSDSWADVTFNVRGPNIDKIRDNTHK
jgi:hypothetical protein